MSPWLVGTPNIYSGTSGTAQLQGGEIVLWISAWTNVANATCQIFSMGPAIPIPNGSTASWFVWFDHQNVRASGSANGASNQIVFVNTVHYFVHTIKPGGTYIGTTAPGTPQI